MTYVVYRISIENNFKLQLFSSAVQKKPFKCIKKTSAIVQEGEAYQLGPPLNLPHFLLDNIFKTRVNDQKLIRTHETRLFGLKTIYTV